jgi:hypothetical protein
MRISRNFRNRQPDGVQTLGQKIAAILRKYGTDAHVYLPGIGVINGLTAGNYLDSAGTTHATVDNPVGLVLDAAGSVGSELIPQPLDLTAWTTIGTLSAVNANSFINTSGGGAGKVYPAILLTTKLYRLEVNYTKSDAITEFGMYANNGSNPIKTSTAASGVLSANTYPAAAGGFYLRLAGNATVTINSVTAQEVTGIHAIQATTANKPILRLSAGRYYFDFVDGTDVLNATYPAGWESVTTIDAAPTGQATLTAQNIVGTYAITTDTYGRFVFKTITASELATIQTFANRLAGL